MMEEGREGGGNKETNCISKEEIVFSWILRNARVSRLKKGVKRIQDKFLKEIVLIFLPNSGHCVPNDKWLIQLIFFFK